MRRKLNLSYVYRLLLISFSLLLLVSCQEKEDERFQILVFSSIPENSLNEMKGLTKNIVNSQMEFDVKLYPAVAERLLLEIVSNAGDILIMERDLLATAYDSDELYELVEFSTKENTILISESELEALRAAGEEIEENAVYSNALRVTNMDEQVIHTESIELVVIIPKYTKNKDIAISILENLVQKK